jgi:hypothetical protein
MRLGSQERLGIALGLIRGRPDLRRCKTTAYGRRHFRAVNFEREFGFYGCGGPNRGNAGDCDQGRPGAGWSVRTAAGGSIMASSRLLRPCTWDAGTAPPMICLTLAFSQRGPRRPRSGSNNQIILVCEMRVPCPVVLFMEVIRQGSMGCSSG